MNESVKVSVIIPVYNAENFISRCLDSVLKNTFSDYEILLFDDGSTDGSWKILQTYAEKYPEKIQAFHQKNQGVAKTRNAGIARAKGEYILFIDNDDWVDSDYLETFVHAIEKENADIVIGGYQRTSNTRILFSVHPEQCEWSKYVTTAPWAKIYRKEFLLAHAIDFLDNALGEDIYFNLQAIHCTKKISLISYAGYHWFFNEHSISNTLQKNLKNNTSVLYLLNRCHQKLKEMRALENSEIEFYFTRYIIWYLLHTGKTASSKELLSSFRFLFSWLSQRFPNFLHNPYGKKLFLKGERFQNSFVIFAFLLLYRFKLAKFFLTLYSSNPQKQNT